MKFTMATGAVTASAGTPWPVSAASICVMSPDNNAGIVESLTALMISINGRYKTHAGVRVTGLPDQLWADPSSS